MQNRFTLRAGNHREIGRSPEMEPDELKEAMALLMKFGADAPIVNAHESSQALHRPAKEDISPRKA